MLGIRMWDNCHDQCCGKTKYSRTEVLPILRDRISNLRGHDLVTGERSSELDRA